LQQPSADFAEEIPKVNIIRAIRLNTVFVIVSYNSPDRGSYFTSLVLDGADTTGLVRKHADWSGFRSAEIGCEERDRTNWEPVFDLRRRETIQDRKFCG